MLSQNTPAVLQLKMRNVRQDLNEHADQMVETARMQFDWRRYVAGHPWASLGAAAAVGYLLAPRRSRSQGVDSQTVKETVDQVVRAAQSLPPPQPSAISKVARELAAVLAATIVREGVPFMSHLARQWLQSGTDLAQESPNGNASGRDNNDHDRSEL